MGPKGAGSKAKPVEVSEAEKQMLGLRSSCDLDGMVVDEDSMSFEEWFEREIEYLARLEEKQESK